MTATTLLPREALLKKIDLALLGLQLNVASDNTLRLFDINIISMDELLKIKARSKVPILFHLRVELGDGQTVPPSGVAAEVTQVLADISDQLQLR
jgi:hypothetical protein